MLFSYQQIIAQNPDIQTDTKKGALPSKATVNVQDDMNGWLFYLCKSWGYFKYFSQHKCDIKWDTLLNTTIKQVLDAQDNQGFNEALMTMFNKAGNNVKVINPVSLPDTNINVEDEWMGTPMFSDSVRSFLDTLKLYTYPDISTCFVKLNDYSSASYTSYIDFRKDALTMGLNYTNEADRLTAMFYYWNVINYFFPFKNITDQPWDSTLYQFIPLMRQISTINDFHELFLKLVTKINDSHGFTNSSILASHFWGGSNYPPIYFVRSDTNCVVAKYKNISGITSGDILVSINGIDIHYIEDSIKEYTPASTSAAMYRDIYKSMLRGKNTDSLTLMLLDSTNSPYQLKIGRSMNGTKWGEMVLDNGNPNSFFITNCGYGYVNMGKLESSEVQAMYDSLKNTPAILFDIRNYPNGTLWDLCSLFFPGPVISAIFYSPALTYPGNGHYLPGWYYKNDDSNNFGSWQNPDFYDGDIYILVNEQTQSQAEYTCQYLSLHPKAKVVGSQTAGADGNVSYLTLPGSLITNFTSLGWYYANGYQQQRNGVKIDTIVTPTREGLRRGLDEVLEAVCQTTGIKEDYSSGNPDIIIYPNPFCNEIIIQTSYAKHSIKYYLINAIGQIIKEGYVERRTVLGTSTLSHGIYFIKVDSEKESKVIKIIK